MKRILFTIVAALFATQVSAFDPADMSGDERAAFNAAIRAYLLENPEVIMEAVAVLEQRQAAAERLNDFQLVADNADALFNDGYSYVGGNPNGDVTIVEFMDYRCGYCRRAHPEVAELLNSDGNIRFIIKELPILGEQSMLASQFAVAVKQIHGPEAYITVSDTLIAYRADITPAALEGIAAELGLDAPAIFAMMMEDSVMAEINNTRALASALNITGTPTFVFQDEMIRGYIPLDAMRQVVDDKRN